MVEFAEGLVGSRTRKIAFVTTIVAAAFFGNVIFYYVSAHYGHAPYPYNTFLPDGLFGDYGLTIRAWQASQFNTVDYGMGYFPATYLFMGPFFNVFGGEIGPWLFAIGLWFFFAAYTYFNVRGPSVIETLRDTVVLAGMSYPILFEIVILNVEGLLFIFLALFAYFFAREKTMLAAAFLAAAIGMKLFPAVFLVLFIQKRQWRSLALCLASFVILSVLPLLIFSGGFFGANGIAGYLTHLSQNLALYANLMIFTVAGMHYGHSLLNGWEAVALPLNVNIHAIARSYELFAGIAFSFLAYFVIFVERVTWRSIAVLTLAMCLLPYTSTDYKLVHLTIPMYLFINDRSKCPSRVEDLIIATCFALIMIPKSPFAVWRNLDPFATANTILNPLLMLVIVAVIVWSGFRRRGQALSL